MNRTSNNKLPLGALTYMIHHVFLPPKLPNEDDFNAEYDTILLDTTINSLLRFKGFITQDQAVIVDCVIAMIMNMRAVRDSNGAVSEEKLADALRDLDKKGGIIPLHIRAQNAGVIISKMNESINLEAFELSPLNEAVITTKGRLQRSFPGPALSLTIQVFEQPPFQATTAQTLAKMSHQSAVGTKPKARKAGRMHDEDRDTTDPKLVTELFMGFLRSVGAPVTVSRLWKNTREEVLWLDSRSPWRRSPLWLLIRVAMQLAFARSSDLSNSPGDLYKFFMLFLMTQVLERSLEVFIPSDILYSMNAKVVRRLLKLDSAVNAPALNFVENVLRKTNTLLDTRWSKIMKQETLHFDLSRLEHLDFERDTVNSLPELDLYIETMANRKNNKGFIAFQPRSDLIKYEAEELPNCLESWTADYRPYNLKAFEAWVASNLNSWLSDHKASSSTCAGLSESIRTYYGIAYSFYSGNPEGMSLMLLTILELWVACDESAIHNCEILRDYDPGIPKELLESLVLPFKSQMERLLRVEDYLERRRDSAKFLAPHIFQEFGHQNTFSARYFAQSPEHERLLADIRTKAASDRQEKQDELRRKKAQYDDLIQLYDQSNCEYYEYNNSWTGLYEERHSSTCQKCNYKSQATALSIRVHEWPLPSDEWEERCTVFELKVPHSFGHWRDTTLFLMLNVLQSGYISEESSRSSHHLQSYTGLSTFFVPFSFTQRTGLLSQNKPHEVTHRRDKPISTTTESDVCLNNGLSYEYYDSETGFFIRNFLLGDEMPKACTYKLPALSSSLQKFIFRPAVMPNGPSPNTVIASQFDCPGHVSLDEYKALSTIPLGYRIQWLHLLRELSLPSVDCKKVETSLVILQSIYQAGPPKSGSVFRESHSILGDENFSYRLLEALYGALQRVKENWESSQALQTFISLAHRLLSLTSSQQIKRECLAYLAKARLVTFSWIGLLRKKAREAKNDDQRIDLGAKAVEVALICVDSFNLDERYLDGVLSVPEDAAILIQCSIVIQQGDLTVSKTTEPITYLLYWRWKALSYRCYTALAKEILEKNNRCLDDAIKKSLPDYQAGYGWRVASHQSNHWLVTQAAPEGDSDPVWVHFNLLDSELLVNGVPMDRLPAQYERHPFYSTLFGNSTIKVMPTTVPGMQFSGEEYACYTLHFGINSFSSIFGPSETDLLIQAMKGGRKCELIPSRVLRGNFPTAFVDDFVHWYDFNDLSIEFRPVEDPWTSSPGNWRLTRPGLESNWHLTKDGSSLVGVKSETAQRISCILSPLEDSLSIHSTFNRQSLSLEIKLPKIQLGFSLKLKESSIQSRQFRGMSIDPDQSLGTLTGLYNKLILKDERQGNRRLIIPEGPVSHQISDGHVRVVIDKTFASKAHAYEVNGRLGTLVDNENLQSKLFLCYLHASTSFCLADPLTRKTGTEQALSILNSAAVRSFGQLSQENVEILEQIAHLTPKRSYYPANERVMQMVEWSSGLGFLAQHGGFYKCVKSIFGQAETTKVFYPESNLVLLELEESNQDLLERDCIRSSTFRVSGFGAEDHTITHDAKYSARDGTEVSARGFRAFLMSSVIYSDRVALLFSISSSSSLKTQLWTFLSQTPEILGPSRPLQSSELKYDARLLLDGSEFFSMHWTVLHQNLGQGQSWIDKFRLMMWLSTLAFSEKADIEILQVLGSFFTVPAMAQISIPQMNSFQLHIGTKAIKNELRNLIKPALLPLRSCPEAQMPSLTGESKYARQNRQQRTFQSKRDRAMTELVNKMHAQFPCEIPTARACGVSGNLSTYIDMAKAMEMVKPRFKTWFENHLFSEYLGKIGDKLVGQTFSPIKTSSSSFSVPKWNLQRRRGFISIDEIFDRAVPPVLSPGPTNITNLLFRVSSADTNALRLAELIGHLDAQAESKYEQDYIKDLQDSMSSLRDWEEKYHLKSDQDLEEILSHHLDNCNERCNGIYSAIASALIPSANNASTVASIARQWPRLSPTFFLQQLSRSRWSKIKDWQHCMVQYGLALTELQRAERLLNSVGKHAELIKELRNPGHTNWSPLEYPETLLLEVENGIMIREVQEQIARQMRDPPFGINAVMQLNMGEGKSSVIIPIVAAALANGSKLVRVIVAKPQSKQMLHMLLSKLGGLLDRRVYHMPFSRKLKLSQAEARTIDSICRECMKNGGILLVQPEHILSFKLMGLEYLITGKEAVGRSLLSTQEFFDTLSRDLVDESDENFSVKFELIYTMGIQRPIELSPERWICIQQVLSLVRIIVPLVKKDFPNSIDFDERRPGAFPRTRILRPSAGQDILSRIAKRICETGLTGFPIARQPESIRQAVFRYITERNLTAEDIAQVENQGQGGFWAEITSNTLLLLRGLLAGGVLAFAFGQKRWRVNYGLDSTRIPGTKLAVPYRAKDSPAPRSEFSHPDVVIVLTCLSYYYEGLKNGELFLALSHLLKSDQADDEYQEWVKDAPELPTAFQDCSGINLKDGIQCTEKVFPSLRYAKAAVDYFLAHIVFPKEMKEFPHKLSASGWDIGQIKALPTTGFSGTNDSRKVLPLSVGHLDLQEQKHTNALVLEYLLQSENSVALMPSRGKAFSSDAELLIATVTNMDPAVQVILDVGAQILELSNLMVASKWLEMSQDHDKTQAAVFFDDTDELCVLDRRGRVEPWQTSPYAKQLDVCLIFLDEAHTRGTDLKLPIHYRAAVTLGPSLTKDRLVQACMRMRQLGKGQSVVFCVPEEIRSKILARSPKRDEATIDVPNVLNWAISETCIDIRRSLPLWATQGQRFERQSAIWAEACNTGYVHMSKDLADKFLEDEAQSLEDRYRPRSGIDVTSFMQAGQNKNLNLIIERCQEFKNLEFGSSTLQEEQERELSPEIEEERQVQKAAPAIPATHKIDIDLTTFVTQGVPVPESKAYKPAFEALCDTSAAAYLNLSQFPRDLLVTADFASTIQISGRSYISDAYQRPVQWVLTSTGGWYLGRENIVRFIMIISPFEAHELLPLIMELKAVTLHLYSPRPNMGFRALDGLDLYTVPVRPVMPTLPRNLIIQLNLFAGQLYFNSYEEYVEVCQFLGLAYEKTGYGAVVAADGFIISRNGSLGPGPPCTFRDSPVKFLKVLMTKIRRNCEGIDKTHMGQILDGKILLPADFGISEDGV
ncbi:hypothetical protein BDZ45DRAFT_800719 [Acephala macrosclerotiorum]|nr:hypothetical protein BDZ45DRAFT_800719 [Acephala macrosclerotiorum]